MSDLASRALDESTWPAFARLVDKHNGVWGGCWCMGFHAEGVGRGTTAAQNRATKQERVRAGTAHAALVFDGDDAVGWCQFGSPDELPRIKHRKAYEQGLVLLPDWRITCFFVDKGHRGRGVAAAALAGALDQIRRLGGGVVESCPEDTAGREVQGRLMYNASLAMFEQQGFERSRQVGKHHWVVRQTLTP
jgi:predicted GNAT family acetyltransferase